MGPVNGATRYFIYDGDVPYAEFDGNGNFVRKFYWGVTGPVCQRNSSGCIWYIADGLGNTRALANDSGTVTYTYTYDAWGEAVSAYSSGTTNNPFRWNGSAGYQYIPSTGLYHAGAREYDPTVGRWLQRDPIAMAGGHPNLYVYCRNRPVDLSDPSGARECTLGPTPEEILANLSYGPGADVDALSQQVRAGLPRTWDQNAMDFGCGMGDACSFGLTDLAREAAGLNEDVHKGGWYIAGQVTGTALTTAISMGGGGAASEVGAVEEEASSAGSELSALRARQQELTEIAKARYPKLAEIEHCHHLEPSYLRWGGRGGPVEKINAAYHQLITNEWRRRFAYGMGTKLSPARMAKEMQEIYEMFPIVP